jgi:hypothetical protein
MAVPNKTFRRYYGKGGETLRPSCVLSLIGEDGMRSMVGKWFNANEQHILDSCRSPHIDSAGVELTVDQLVDWRMEKKQHMRWTKRGRANVALGTLCATQGQIHELVALKIIAGIVDCGLTPNFFPVRIYVQGDSRNNLFCFQTLAQFPAHHSAAEQIQELD